MACDGQTEEPDPAGVQRFDVLADGFQRAPEPVQFPDHHHIEHAEARIGQELCQDGPLAAGFATGGLDLLRGRRPAHALGVTAEVGKLKGRRVSSQAQMVTAQQQTFASCSSLRT